MSLPDLHMGGCWSNIFQCNRQHQQLKTFESFKKGSIIQINWTQSNILQVYVSLICDDYSSQLIKTWNPVFSL